MKWTVERRHYERYRVEDGSLAMLWPASSKIGQIIDISMGGLSFRYFVRSKLKESFAELESEVEIICNKHQFNSDSLPIRTISDCEMDNHFVDFLQRQQRRRSVEFGELDDAQKTQIQKFIEKHCEPIPMAQPLPSE